MTQSYLLCVRQHIWGLNIGNVTMSYMKTLLGPDEDQISMTQLLSYPIWMRIIINMTWLKVIFCIYTNLE